MTEGLPKHKFIVPDSLGLGGAQGFALPKFPRGADSGFCVIVLC